MSDVTAAQGATLGLTRRRLGEIADLLKRGDIALAVGMMTILVVLILPLPPVLLDLFLAVSIILSVLILMTALFIHAPLEFSAFPTVLLIATMLRLALNLASTRLILARGHEGTDAAGHVIQAFGNFVMGGNFVIGIIVFTILVIVNFVGIAQQGLPFSEAVRTYTALTVGDGLVTQIPALIVSTAAGLLVAKAGVSGAADQALIRQLSSYPKALGISAAAMVVMALLPGIPMLPFLMLGGGAAFLAYVTDKGQRNQVVAETKKADVAKAP